MSQKWMLSTVAALLLLGGCSSNNEEAMNEIEETAVDDEQSEVEEVEEVLPYSSPLSGIGLKEKPTGRAFAVMINNDPKARPQSGLHKADLVFETLAEGNVTRFLAFYQSEMPERIGPVRSARDYYLELTKGYDALYVAHGYSPEAKEMLDRGYVDNINGMQYDGTLFKRDSSRVAPHNSYITPEKVQEGAEMRGYDMSLPPSSLPFLTKEELEQLAGKPADSVLISYYASNLFNVIYEFDEELMKYRRYTNGELTADLDTSEPVLLDNIFIIEASHRIIDDVGRRDIDISSGGRAYLLQKGQWQEVEWKNSDGKILPYANGEEVGLIPGKTWINVIPSDQGLEEVVSFEVE